jgi:hypothetical protein
MLVVSAAILTYGTFVVLNLVGRPRLEDLRAGAASPFRSSAELSVMAPAVTRRCYLLLYPTIPI